MVEISIFISSKMQELADERQMLIDFLPSLNEGMMKLKPWIFEKDAPASNKSIREVYLKALQNSELYLGLFWNDYGEYTIDEFEKAGEWNITRHIYVKDVEANRRNPKLSEFLEAHGDVKRGITAKWFKTIGELKAAIELSIGEWLRDSLHYRSGAIAADLYDDPDDVKELTRSGLFGRDTVKSEILASFKDDNSRVLMQAFGGTGKTALAAHISKDWLENSGGKVLWLRLGASSPDAAFEALAQPFGASAAVAGAADNEKYKVVRNLIRGHEVDLVVLDDVWNGATLEAVQEAIPRKVPLLVTARQRYPLGKIITLPDLAEDDSLALLRKIAGDLVQDEDAARKLCRNLSNLAFAIEIAGRTMQAKNYPAQKMLDDLEGTDITQLEVPLEFRKEGRENVAVLIGHTLDVLPDDAKNAFFAWGAFWSKRITAEMMNIYMTDSSVGAQHVAPLQHAEENLNLLQQYGLATRIAAINEGEYPLSIAHYILHDLAHAYAQAKNSDDERNRAVDNCLTYTKRYKKPSRPNFAALVPEIDNFMGAATFAMQQERYSDVERFAWDLDSGSEVFGYQGYYTHSIDLLQQAALAAEKAGNQHNQGAHLGNLGNAYRNLGQYEKAIDYYEQILVIHRDIGDKRGEGADLGNLGNTYVDLGQYQKAIDYHEKALKISQEIGDKRGEGQDLGNLGIAYRNLGQYENAIDYYEQGLVIQREIGDVRGQGAKLGNLGIAYRNLGQYEKAIDYYQQALTISRDIGDKLGESTDLNNLGVAYGNLEDYDKAIDYYEQALVIRRELGNPHLIEQTERNLEITKRKRDGGSA